MAEDLSIIQGTKEEQYTALLPQIKALVEGEPDLIANLANICGSKAVYCSSLVPCMMDKSSAMFATNYTNLHKLGFEKI